MPPALQAARHAARERLSLRVAAPAGLPLPSHPAVSVLAQPAPVPTARCAAKRNSLFFAPCRSRGVFFFSAGFSPHRPLAASLPAWTFCHRIDRGPLTPPPPSPPSFSPHPPQSREDDPKSTEFYVCPPCAALPHLISFVFWAPLWLPYYSLVRGHPCPPWLGERATPAATHIGLPHL